MIALYTCHKHYLDVSQGHKSLRWHDTCIYILGGVHALWDRFHVQWQNEIQYRE